MGKKNSDYQDSYQDPNYVEPTSTPSEVAESAATTGLPVEALKQGETTTTTPDSVQQGQVIQGVPVGELDAKSADERIKLVRGWRAEQRRNLSAPGQAHWEELDKILGSEAAGEVRRP